MSQEEKQWLSRARKGDAEAFAQLITLNEKRLYNIAFRMMGHREDAMDMAQEAMLRAYRSMDSFSGKSAFSTWIYRITVNTCLDELRKRKKRQNVSLNYLVEEKGMDMPDNPEHSPETRAVVHDMQGKISALLLQLKPQQRAIIILRDVQGFSYREIAQMLQVTEGTVKSRINRARLKLLALYHEQWQQTL